MTYKASDVKPGTILLDQRDGELLLVLRLHEPFFAYVMNIRDLSDKFGLIRKTGYTHAMRLHGSHSTIVIVKK